MSTADGIFSQFERDELNKITAKSILEKLMNIRQKIDVEFTARRLGWELIQNAKDNASLCNEDSESVDITIEITDTELIFSHNKGYFTNEHIRGLIRKYSSSDKDRDVEQLGQIYKTTGRFGTGFMTTHLLSEKVQIESYYKNDHQTFKKFSFWLDRSGKGEKEIIQGINNAFNEAEVNIKKSPNIILDKSDFSTSFIYPLTDRKKSLAHIAIEEVKVGIAYTLINVPVVNSVTIEEELIGSVSYEVKLIDKISYSENEFLVYNLLVDGKKSKSYYLALTDKELQIILPVSKKNNKYYALELDANIPRLHLDFPLIGTEDLNLPFIVNSPLFEPTEPRDGVSLIDDEDNQVSQLNCDVLVRAVSLYKQFLSYVGNNENWHDLYNLARIKSPKKHSWIDSDWFRDNVVESIRNALLYTPMVDVVNGDRIAIWNDAAESQVYFPYAEKDSIREQIWQLSKRMYPQYTPVREHIDQWYEIIWKDCYKLSISELSKEIQNRENLANLADALKGKERESLNFLNDYYNLLNLEGSHIKDIISDKFEVIPNQLEVFKKKSELHIDENIDEEIKNVCSIISKDPREYLIHKNAFTGENITYPVKDQMNIISEINSIIKGGNNDSISKVCDYLASLFPDKDIPEKRLAIFEFSKRVYPNDFTERRKLKYYDEKIWEESDKKSIAYIILEISNCKTIEKATEELDFNDKDAFISWLDTLITFLVKEGFDNNINREQYPVLPNQNGVFCTKDDLFLDDGEIDEVLKDISAELGYDFREELLDTSIFLELPENRIQTIEDIAEKISASIKPILRDVDKRKELKETLKKFYMWMNENKEKADAYFSDLFEKRFLFLEDDDISLNMKKATEYDQLKEEYGFKSIKDIRNRLSQLQNDNNLQEDTEKVDITKEILVNLGISSPKELEEAFKDPAISSKFYHTSTPTTEMFIYAQRRIERAKQNIIQFLENHPDYDCTDLEETAPTILAGIIKNGVSIHIVTRPSDNGEVIIYYSSEKDTLDSDNSELWIDNGVDPPHILTLGRILKSTGINRIPINMI
ncbi:MAG: hypothetical protein KF860_10415 [Cyclobacteriaceae bacterium]|nr:hypothetical protein [Cyclobacteriaceae bacterium]